MQRLRLAIVAAIVVLAAVAAGVAVAARPAHHHVTRAQEQAFEANVVPLVTDGGRVVEDGMKPALHDLTTDHVTPPSFIAGEATQWQATLQRDGHDLAAVRATGQLARARDLLVRAVGIYAAAAADFHAAALATGAERNRLIDSGIATAERGDATYDEGAAIVQALRRSLGLGPSASFPDPGHE